MAQTDLSRGSVLFWLVVLIAVGIIFIGVRFLVSPSVGATAFGVPADGMPTMSYLWAKGTRDIVSGLLVFALLAMKASRRLMAAFILVAALIPIADFVNVYWNVGSSNRVALMTHGLTAVFMVTLAALLWRSGPVDRRVLT